MAMAATAMVPINHKKFKKQKILFIAMRKETLYDKDC